MSPLEGGLGITYDVHLWLIGKRVLDFLLLLIDLFRWVIRLGTAISPQRGQFDPKFLVEEDVPPIIFARIVMLMNALQLCR